MLNPDRYRELRGLVIHFRENWPRVRQARRFQRGLVPTFKPYGGTAGACRWCRLPTERKLRWHPTGCVDAYRAATGQSLHNIWGTAKAPPCPCGEPARELDHQDALILAWTSGDPRRTMRAYMIDNLLWLCTTCHAAKTKRDLAQLKEMRDQQVCLAGLIPRPTEDSTMGITEWVLAEGGRLTNILRTKDRTTGTNRLSMRRGPITFQPSETTCPRCLTAMSRPEAQGFDAAQLPAGFHLDERPYLARLIPAKRERNTAPTPQLPLEFPVVEDPT